MERTWLLLAYFGPETQLPLMSLVGALSGLAMIFVRSPGRLVSRYCRLILRRPLP